MKDPKTILITGASSGLGKALALAYAKKDITLFLTGRDEARLHAVADACRQQGATVEMAVLDITNANSTEEWINAMDAIRPIDLAIANAGISAGTGGEGESDAQVRKIFSVNIGGVINTLHPLIAPMKARGKGQLAILSSLAGYRGLPSSPAYSASKAAVRVYGEGLRGHLQDTGVAVNVITPGYIKTPMTDVNDFPMPFLMEAEKAASIIQRKLAKNKSRIAFPLPFYFLVWLISCLPVGLTDPIFARLPAKPSENNDHDESSAA